MFDKIFSKLADFIILRSRWIITITILLVVFFTFMLTQLRFDGDASRWVSRTSAIGKLPNYISERFGSFNPIIVGIEFDDVFTSRNLNLLKKFQDDLDAMKVAGSLMSIANVENVIQTEDGIKVEKLIKYPLPDDKKYLSDLKKYTLSKKNYAKKLVSEDGRVALFVIKPITGMKTDTVANDVKKLAKEVFNDKNIKLYYTGNPFLINSISEMVIADFVFLIPMVIILVMLILFISFRTIRGVALPLLTVLFSVIITMGFMGLIGIKMNVLSSAVPILLVAVGSAYGIHVMNNYYENTRRYSDRGKIIKNGLLEIGLPVLMAGLTTIAGFISNLTSETSVIQLFGIFCSIGVFLAMVIALVFITSAQMNMKIQRNYKIEKKLDAEKDKKKVHISKFIDILGDFVVEHKYLVIIIFCIVGIGLFSFTFRITAKADFLAYFKEGSEPRIASSFINKNFGGFNSLSVYAKADIQNPDVLKYLLMVQERIKSYKDLSSPTGIVDSVCELNQAMGGFYTIPETRQEIENLWFFIEGKEMLESMVTKEKNETLITTLLPKMDNFYLNNLFKYIQDFTKEYSNEVKIIDNVPGNPYIVRLEKEMMGNLMDNLKIRTDDKKIGSIVQKMVEGLENAKMSFPKQKLLDYSTGDEAEIIISKEVASVIMNELEKMKNYTAKKIEDLIDKTIPDKNNNSTEDIAAFAKSLNMMIRQENKQAIMIILKEKLIKEVPELSGAGQEDISYVLSPLIWDTIPVPDSTAGGIIRTVPIEKVELTGVAYLFDQLRQALLWNQLTSIIIALLAVLILNWITFKSFLEGLISMVAIVFTIMFNFGVMGILNIPLDYVTAIIGSILIGTGIDYTIHFIIRYSLELKRNNQDMAKAYKITLATAGKAVIFNALTVGLGFLVLMGSNVLPLRTVGLLLCVTMFVSSTAALTFLPAVLMSSQKVMKKIVEKE